MSVCLSSAVSAMSRLNEASASAAREWRQSTRRTVDDEGEESAAPYDTRMVWYSPEGIRCERANSLQTVQRADAKEDE